MFNLIFKDVVDFGIRAANNKTISTHITIKNSGATNGDFLFSYKGKETITFTPSTGSVPPKAEILIRVSKCCHH